MITEVWVLEAAYDCEGSNVVAIFDHKPTKKEQTETIAGSHYQGADEYIVSKWPVKRIGKR
jgi:hypothetical protein